MKVKPYQKQALVNANREIARLRAIIKALEASQAYSYDTLKEIAVQLQDRLGNAYYRSMKATDTLD